MKLSEYLDEAKLAEYVNRGLVSARHHNTLPLTIYCYTRKTVYSNHWDEITTKTRGLIVSKEGDIIARPYEKFFSIGQPGGPTLEEIQIVDKEYGPPVITEKINGHLGILWRYGAHWGIATKGSFHSPHAEFATKWLENHIEEQGKLVFPNGYTPIFEIICQEIQPHAIRYSQDGLFLLSFMNNETGEEMDQLTLVNYADKNNLDVPIDYSPDHEADLDEYLAHDSQFIEGYVMTWNVPNQGVIKIKVKFPTFIAKRRLFYAKQKAEKAITELDKTVPTDHERAKAIVKEALVSCTTRKEFAEYFNRAENQPYTSECFKILDYDGGK